MSHYNSSNTTGSWQSQKNNSSTSSSSGSSNAYNSNTTELMNVATQATNQTNLTGLYNNSAAASLLAQFSALNPVNLNTLAANLVAANANVLQLQQQQQQQSTQNASSGYQWHSQNKLAQTSNSTSSSLSGQNSSNNQTYLLGPGGTMNQNNKSSNMNKNNSYEPKPLMEMNSSKSSHKPNNSNYSSSSSSNSKSYSSSSNSNNNNNNNNKQNSSSSRYDSRDRSNQSSNSSNRYNSNSNNNNNNNNTSMSNSTNQTNLANQLQQALPALTPNPLLAQALLNQLAAAQTNNTNSSNNALVAAVLGAANLTVQQPQQQQQTQMNNKHSRRSRSRSSRSRSRSRSRNSSQHSRSTRNNHSRIDSNRSIDNRAKRNSRSKSPSGTNYRSSYTNSTSTNSLKNSTSKREVSKEAVKEQVKDNSSFTSTNKEITKESSNRDIKSYTSSSQSSSRYSIKLPKYSLDNLTNNVASLKNRYSNLYIPSDYTNSKNTWLNSLPINRPLKFNSKCSFHIMSKEAHSLCKNTAVYEPNDADHKWTVKVMLLSMPNLEELYKRSCSFAEDNLKENRYEHPSKVIQFLVGNKGKHDLMALGGPWSPSLDGPNPATNNQTLINTAVRTVKSLTGIDLSPCTQWFRFLDIQYNRCEEFKARVVKKTNCLVNLNESKNGQSINETNTEPIEDQQQQHTQQQLENEQETEMLNLNDDNDVETTVIFLPNVWSLMPTSIEYQKIVDGYKNLIENQPSWLEEEQAEAKQNLSEIKNSIDSNSKQEDIKEQMEQNSTESNDNQSQQQSQQTTDAQTNGKSLKEVKSETECENESTNLTLNSLIQSNNEIPTHYSKLDLKKMKVDELRSELGARGLDTKGLKQQLLNRLKDATEAEKQKDGVDVSNESKENVGLEESINESKENSINLSQTNEEEQPSQNVEASSNNNNNTEANQVIKADTSDLNKQDQPIQSSQTPSQTTTTNTQKQLSKTEKERLYKIPHSPHIIVHPSSTAKQNKFDCQLISLNHLLDYRKDDSKESSFEVFLFAECFNEMLIRDNGFLIYKHLLTLKVDNSSSTPNNVNTTTTTTTTNNNNNNNETNNSNNKRKASDEETDEGNKKTKTNDNIETNGSTSSSSSSSATLSNQNKDSQSLKPRPKTVYPELLLSFTYLDSNRTNYIYEKDLEDLLFLIGLNQSRSKVKILLKKLPIRDGLFNYRSLTDKPIISTVSNLVNQVYYKLPTDDDISNSIITFDLYMKRLELGKGNSNKITNSDNSIIELNGSTIDVLSTIRKLEKSETNLQKLDVKYKESMDELDRMKIMNKNLERNKQKLQDETVDLKKRLRDQQKMTKEVDDKYLRLKDCVYRTKSQLNRVLDDISDTTKRNQPPSVKTSNNTKTNDNVTKLSNGKEVSNNQVETEKSTNENEEKNLNQEDEASPSQSQSQSQNLNENSQEAIDCEESNIVDELKEINSNENEQTNGVINDEDDDDLKEGANNQCQVMEC